MTSKEEEMNPSIGRIVLYKLTMHEVDQINRRRVDYLRYRNTPEYRDTGYMAHAGNVVRAGDQYPMVIVRTFSGTTVNGQVLLDGTDLLWVTSRIEGESEGQWSWPPRV